MLARAGSAFTLIGLIALTIFLVTFSVDRGDVRVLLAGAALSALGLLLRRRGARARSGRFQTLRRLLGHTTEEENLE